MTKANRAISQRLTSLGVGLKTVTLILLTVAVFSLVRTCIAQSDRPVFAHVANGMVAILSGIVLVATPTRESAHALLRLIISLVLLSTALLCVMVSFFWPVIQFGSAGIEMTFPFLF